MKNEIDALHYCAAGFYSGDCFRYGKDSIDATGCICTLEKCVAYRRKWETPEQYKERTGDDWPEDAAIYYLQKTIEIIPGASKVRKDYWHPGLLAHFKDSELEIVCANTDWGCPPDTYRGQE
jgi:hypothetical protein